MLKVSATGLEKTNYLSWNFCLLLILYTNSAQHLYTVLPSFFNMQETIYELLVDSNDISWKSIIYELIKNNKMDPWDIDISLLADTYIARIKQLKEQDLKVSGKVVLAASMLLRIKSNKLVGENIDDFDRLLSGDVSAGEFYDSLEAEFAKSDAKGANEDFELLPRLPQGRKRKVSVYDLVKALEKALEVKHRRVLNSSPPPVVLPTRKFDVTSAISNLMNRILSIFSIRKNITFNDLVPGGTKQDKVYTIIPLLHLSNQRKVELVQDIPFGTINVNVLEGKNVQQ